MKFHLEIDCDNAAFAAFEGRGAVTELRRILANVRELAAIEVKRFRACNVPDPDDGFKLRDSNGNTVGRLWWTDDAKRCVLFDGAEAHDGPCNDPHCPMPD